MFKVRMKDRWRPLSRRLSEKLKGWQRMGPAAYWVAAACQHVEQGSKEKLGMGFWVILLRAGVARMDDDRVPATLALARLVSARFQLTRTASDPCPRLPSSLAHTVAHRHPALPLRGLFKVSHLLWKRTDGWNAHESALSMMAALAHYEVFIENRTVLTSQMQLTDFDNLLTRDTRERRNSVLFTLSGGESDSIDLKNTVSK